MLSLNNMLVEKVSLVKTNNKLLSMSNFLMSYRSKFVNDINPKISIVKNFTKNDNEFISTTGTNFVSMGRGTQSLCSVIFDKKSQYILFHWHELLQH
jgi:hypothetical protein